MKNKSILRLCVLAASVLCAGGLSADDTYKVTVNTTGCSQSRTDDYPAGTEITFKAQPSSGFRFDHWSNGSTENPYTVRITQDTVLSAVFAELPPTPPTPQEPDPVILPVPAYHLVIGSNNCNQVSENDYPQGSTFTFTAKPQTGWIFRQWSDGNTDNPRTLTLTQDSVLTAVFDLLPTTEHHVIIRANDCGEQWEGDCLHRTEITLNAEPESGYKFSHWSDGNTDNPRNVTVTGDATYTAVFAKNTFLISFVNYDGTELQSSELEAGTMPQYNGITPTKPADAQYTYTFAGWDKEVVAVTGDATYTAVFVSVVQCGTIETTDGITVWEDQLPYTWEGISFTTAGTETKTLQASDGCDSVVTFTLRVRYHNIVLQENEDAQYYNLFTEDYNGQTVTTATLNRQFSNGKWATLCLPFEVRKGQMTALGLYGRVYAYQYAEMPDASTIIVHFSVAQSIEAGKGYIVSANVKLAQKTSFVFSNVRINTNADNGDITALTGYNDGSGRGNLYLVGTLRTGLLIGANGGNTYLGLKDNKLYYPNTAAGTSIRAYRGFFRSSEAMNINKVRIVAEGEEVTELEVVNGEISDADWDDRTPSVRKFIEKGILYIERNGKVYNVQGTKL